MSLESRQFTIAVDAMGGDHAPGPEVRGALACANAGIDIVLVGREDRIERELAELDVGRELGTDHITIVNATEVVEMDDSPAAAYRSKRDSSLRVALNLVANGVADAVVSAGHSGAILVHANMVLRRIPGLERPGIVALWPTPTGDTVVLCDVGANSVVKPSMLAQFGVLGACFDTVLTGKEKPRVGILSNGSEPSKGTELTRNAAELLGAAASRPESEFEFVGYVEGNEILTDKVDVVCTDGFTGNVLLKVGEGVSDAMLQMVRTQLESSFLAKVGGALARSALLELRDTINPSEVGGAPLLGVNGLVMICHGRADALAIENAVRAAKRYLHSDLVGKLTQAIGRHQSAQTDAT